MKLPRRQFLHLAAGAAALPAAARIARARSVNGLSFRLYAGPLDHRTPAGGFLAHERIVPFGCAAFDVRALLGEALADVRHVQDFDEFSVEPLHDRLWCGGGG